MKHIKQLWQKKTNFLTYSIEGFLTNHSLKKFNLTYIRVKATLPKLSSHIRKCKRNNQADSFHHQTNDKLCMMMLIIQNILTRQDLELLKILILNGSSNNLSLQQYLILSLLNLNLITVMKVSTRFSSTQNCIKCSYWVLIRMEVWHLYKVLTIIQARFHYKTSKQRLVNKIKTS